MGSLRINTAIRISFGQVQAVDPRRMSSLDVWVDGINEIAVAVADATLRELGVVHPPAVHILVEGASCPYLGYLTCRPFLRGRDAAAAVTGLGVLPAALGASRLVIAWEHADLCGALEAVGSDSSASGVLVVDANRVGHMLRWHPMRMGPAEIRDLGSSTVRADRDLTLAILNAKLPGPVDGLLSVWRTGRAGTGLEITRVCDDLLEAGYGMRWLDLSDVAAVSD